MRCPACRHPPANRMDAFRALPRHESLTPRSDSVHPESGLSFHTGKRPQAQRHNVGMDFTVMASMPETKWARTWFENVSIRANVEQWHMNLRCDTPSSRHVDATVLHFRDCKVTGGVEIYLNAPSSVRGLVGIKGVMGNPNLEVNPPKYIDELQPVSPGKIAHIEDVSGFGTVTLRGSCIDAKNIAAENIKISFEGDSVVISPEASDAITVRGSGGTVVINHPDQWLIVATDFRGKIVENVPAMITYADFAGSGQPVVHGSPVHLRDMGRRALRPEEGTIRRELCRRKSDGSEGRYLHPHNQPAWDALLEGGYIARHVMLDENGDENGETYSLDEAHLALMLILYPNP